MEIEFGDIKISKVLCQDLEKQGYEEIRIVGDYLLIKKDAYALDVPKEIKLYIPPTPFALRKLVNRDKTFRIASKRWLKNGLPRRKDPSKPAEVTYYKDGSVHELKWFNQEGHYHREDGKPAIVRFSSDGLIADCFWLSKGQDFSDKVEELCQENGWDRLRLGKEQIEQVRSKFFTKSNYY